MHKNEEIVIILMKNLYEFFNKSCENLLGIDIFHEEKDVKMGPAPICTKIAKSVKEL